MCGWVAIVGEAYKNYQNRVGNKEIWAERLQHRGIHAPLDYGNDHFYVSHIRLPIQGDVPEPIISSQKEALVYNGEIFNYDTAAYRSDARWLFEKLRDGLGHPDVPPLVLDGFYSFAYLDGMGRMFIATDYLAQKPVYYLLDESGNKIISAASEMRGLIRSVDDSDLDQFWLSTVRKFRYYPLTDGRTWHRRIKTLYPGSALLIFPDGMFEGVSFDPLQVQNHRWDEKHDFNAATQKLQGLLRHAVETRVELSDVPVSICLSGGLDSSAVYKLAQEKFQGKIDLNPFTFENGTDQEYVGLIDRDTKILKHLKENELSEIMRVNEGPVDLGSMIPQYYLGEAIKDEGFVVAISGDGADEFFGGYRRALQYDSQQSDVWSELVNYHLPRLDKMMMNSTVELRCPFLSKPVVEFALSLPWEWRQGKKILKEAMRGIVPDEIIDRPKEPLKIGSVREDKEKHSLRLMDEWLQQEDKI